MECFTTFLCLLKKQNKTMKLFAFTFFIIINFTLSAQTGSLSRKSPSTDKNGALPSVNVFILNTNLGAGADENGNYKITGIPEGEHEVRFSAIGYQTKVVDVEIFPGKTTELNTTLSEAVIEMESVQVTGMKVQQQNDTRTSLIDLNPRNAKMARCCGRCFQKYCFNHYPVF